ncbi:unnamed protein product [Haemonchus placei]|uniref:Uncharacterized protein n=1 Tax=Haemonchus placei TaxID=6290 RepID=A0A0N4WXE3_HAEPC|nr:unnamed protein product [Haemonchus placei]
MAKHRALAGENHMLHRLSIIGLPKAYKPLDYISLKPAVSHGTKQMMPHLTSIVIFWSIVNCASSLPDYVDAINLYRDVEGQSDKGTHSKELSYEKKGGFFYDLRMAKNEVEDCVLTEEQGVKESWRNQPSTKKSVYKRMFPNLFGYWCMWTFTTR